MDHLSINQLESLFGFYFLLFFCNGVSADWKNVLSCFFQPQCIYQDVSSHPGLISIFSFGSLGSGVSELQIDVWFRKISSGL